jgi:nitrogen regulatory protein P-II 2
MKQITVIVKPFVAEAVLRVVSDFEVHACIVDEVKGYGRQKGYLDRYQGSEFSLAFLPKVEIVVWLDDQQCEPLLERIKETARTGRMGDGKIFVQAAAWPQPLEF